MSSPGTTLARMTEPLAHGITTEACVDDDGSPFGKPTGRYAVVKGDFSDCRGDSAADQAVELHAELSRWATYTC